MAENCAQFRDEGIAEIYAVVNAYDNRDHGNLPKPEFRVDGVLVEPDLVQSTRTRDAVRWRAYLVRPALGTRKVEAVVRDQHGNSVRLERSLEVMAFTTEPTSVPGEKPRFHVLVDGGLEAARADTAIRVAFSQAVYGVDPGSLLLENLMALHGWSCPPGVCATKDPCRCQISQSSAYIPFTCCRPLDSRWAPIGFGGMGSIHNVVD